MTDVSGRNRDHHPLEELDCCIFTRDIPELKIKQGEQCVIMMVYAGAYMVEVMSDCEPYKNDDTRDWVPVVPWEAVTPLRYV